MTKEEKEFIESYHTNNYWIINKNLVKEVGLKETLYLSHLLSKWEYFRNKGLIDDEGWFYNLQKDIQEETRMERHTQTRILNKLLQDNLVETKRNQKRKNYYRLTLKNILNIVLQGNKMYQCNGTKCTNVMEQNVPRINNNKYTNNKVKELHSKECNSSVFSKRKKSSLKNNFLDNQKNVPSSILEIINYWNNKNCLLKINDSSTKIFKGTVLALKQLFLGTFFQNNSISFVYEKYQTKNFTKEEILETIDKFAYYCKSMLPGKDKAKKMSLKSFLYNPYAKRVNSMFLSFYEKNKDTLANEIIEDMKTPKKENILGSDKNSLLTSKLIALYKSQGIDQELTTNQKNKFILASEKLQAFYNKIIRVMIQKITIVDFAELYFESMKEQFRGQTLSVGNFDSDYSFDVVLPTYLKNYHYILEE